VDQVIVVLEPDVTELGFAERVITGGAINCTLTINVLLTVVPSFPIQVILIGRSDVSFGVTNDHSRAIAP
jgi:hypothetical protein